jgi:hypothetical protein
MIIFAIAYSGDPGWHFYENEIVTRIPQARCGGTPQQLSRLEWGLRVQPSQPGLHSVRPCL